MGFVYEIVISGTQSSQPIANVFHVWDGDENATADEIADVFEDNFLVDARLLQVDDLTWNRIAVNALDVGNGEDPLVRTIAIVGNKTADPMPTGVHCWVKFDSDDNGFKAGGKLFAGLAEDIITIGRITSAALAAIQLVFDDLLVDLAAAGLALAIYRPSLSTPGFPSISISSNVLARGVGTNNRRQEPFTD